MSEVGQTHNSNRPSSVSLSLVYFSEIKFISLLLKQHKTTICIAVTKFSLHLVHGITAVIPLCDAESPNS